MPCIKRVSHHSSNAQAVWLQNQNSSDADHECISHNDFGKQCTGVACGIDMPVRVCQCAVKILLEIKIKLLFVLLQVEIKLLLLMFAFLD